MIKSIHKCHILVQRVYHDQSNCQSANRGSKSLPKNHRDFLLPELPFWKSEQCRMFPRKKHHLPSGYVKIAIENGDL